MSTSSLKCKMLHRPRTAALLKDMRLYCAARYRTPHPEKARQSAWRSAETVPPLQKTDDRPAHCVRPVLPCKPHLKHPAREACETRLYVQGYTASSCVFQSCLQGNPKQLRPPSSITTLRGGGYDPPQSRGESHVIRYRRHLVRIECTQPIVFGDYNGSAQTAKFGSQRRLS